MCRCLKYFFSLMTTVLFFTTPSLAVDRVWTNALLTQEFTSAGNWNPTTDPLDAADNYYINLYSVANCPILGSTSPVATVGQLSVGSNYGGSTSSGRMIINGGTLTANDQVFIGWNANTTDTSYLDMTGGTFNFIRGATETDVRVGFQGGKGQMNMSSGAIANITGGRLFLGDQAGTGQLNMTDSTATITTGELVMACGANSLATANINGSSTLNINGGALIGDGGTATMTMGGYASVTNYGSGSFDKNVLIGRSGGYGTLNVTGGYYEQFYGYCILGDGAGATGEVNVSGSGYFSFHKYLLDPVNNGYTYMIVGNDGGKGKITVSGGIMEFQGMMLGRYGNSEGTLDIQGGAVTSGGLCVGFDGGKGTVTMSGGSFASTAGTLEIGRNTRTNSKFTLSGGTVTHSGGASDVVVGEYGGEGTLEMTGGTFDQSVGSLYLGNINYNPGNIYPDGRAKGYLNIANSAYNFSTSNGTVYVGNFDCNGTISITTGGAMTLSNGATLRVGSVSNSSYGGSTGTITMNGGTFNVGLSDTNKASNAYIGSGWGDTGRLDMSNGAIFNNFITGDCFIGDNAGTGTLTMVGSDPLARTTFNCPKALRVGNGGTGTIEMNQNSALNTGNYLVIGGGNSSSALGNLAMTGNAIITRTGDLSMFIGENLATGHGTMSNTSSITSSSADLEIGKRGGVGDLTMNDNSSITLDTRTMYVGYGATGVVTMNGSSNITTKNLNIGQYLRDGAGTVADPYVYTKGVGSLNIGEGVDGENPTITLPTGGVMNLGYSLGSTKKNNEIPCTGTVVMKGGTFDAGAVDPVTLGSTLRAWFGCGSGASASWTQDGGTAIMPPVDVAASDSSSVVGGSATFNFNGGVFAANAIRVANSGDKGAKGSLTINFNGGTLLARQSTTFFIYRRNMPAANCQVNVTSNGGTIDSFGSTGRFALGAEIREAITNTGTGPSGSLTFKDTNTDAPNTGVISLSGNNAGFLGNITITGGTLAGGGNTANAPAITPAGDNAFGFGSADRTITVKTGGTLAFRHTNMYAGDYSASAIPTIIVDGGTLAVQPIIAESGTAPNYVYTYAGTRAAVNNVTLNNGTMTSMTGTTIAGAGTNIYAWNINGTVTSKGTSTINYAASPTPSAPAAVAALIALQSGNMANPNTTFDVQDGTLTVSSPLTNGLSNTGVARATSLTKAGTGKMTILGALSYTGNTDIQNGTFQIATTTPVILTTVTGTSAGTLAVCDGASLTATSIQVGTLSIGGPAGAAAAAAVPEPGTFVLLALAGLTMAGAFFRRK
jgi:fibronectin-binding autotransporter adhesin